ncbi:MAG: EAL domain-containing protein [Ruminococcus sp.]|nr:EAL domain-containing protein [Ruminococcus sp.]
MKNEAQAFALIKDYISKAAKIKNNAELDELDAKYSELLEKMGDPLFDDLLNDISGLARRLLKRSIKTRTDDTAELSGAARKEYLSVQRLLNENLLTYHFQPIIRADNGEIFAYEALMRAKGIEGITPYHILKYAELSGRTNEVEEYTFLNVLKLMTDNSDMLHGRTVFINSMAKVQISPGKTAEIERLLAVQSGKVVIEFTENSQFDDGKLGEIKEKYATLGIPVAIDDYGTGYSNISNLLRYTPDFVKIDRALISGIESNANKKHFVREIIDFCHENNIKALAEGVETAEELRTVIILGADLIQGFYTARPSAEPLDEIPYSMRSEIRTYRLELEDGKRLKIYSAEKYEKLSLERLAKEGYSCIHVGFGYHDGSVSVIGTNRLDSGLHIVCADGFHGKLVLENAFLSNTAGRPCIDIGRESSVTIALIGMSKLEGGGIRVEESSKLYTEGNGDLDIRLGGSDYYGIGNELSSPHGRLEFGQDGTISVTANSHSGICIGSGMGGEIVISKGRYVFNAAGASSIGVGSYMGDTNIEILGCDFEMTGGGAYCIGIGSVSGKAKVHIIYSSVRMTLYSQQAVGVGSLMGSASDIDIESMSITIEISASDLSMIGSVYGASNISVQRSAVNLTGDGTGALAFGGIKGNTKLTLTDIDLLLKLSNALNVCVIADDNSVHIKGGRYRITLNNQKTDTL